MGHIISEKEKIANNQAAQRDCAEILKTIKEGLRIKAKVKNGKRNGSVLEGVICSVHPSFFQVNVDNYKVTINNYEVLTNLTKIIAVS